MFTGTVSEWNYNQRRGEVVLDPASLSEEQQNQPVPSGRIVLPYESLGHLLWYLLQQNGTIEGQVVEFSVQIPEVTKPNMIGEFATARYANPLRTSDSLESFTPQRNWGILKAYNPKLGTGSIGHLTFLHAVRIIQAERRGFPNFLRFQEKMEIGEELLSDRQIKVDYIHEGRVYRMPAYLLKSFLFVSFDAAIAVRGHLDFDGELIATNVNFGTTSE